MINANFEINSTGGQWNLGDYINQEVRSETENEGKKSELKDDHELVRLRQKYQLEGHEITSSIEDDCKQVSRRIYGNDEVLPQFRNNSQTVTEVDNERRLPFREQLNKSFEQNYQSNLKKDIAKENNFAKQIFINKVLRKANKSSNG